MNDTASGGLVPTTKTHVNFSRFLQLKISSFVASMAMQNYTHFIEWWDLMSKVARTEPQVATPYDNLAHTGLASKLQQSISDPWVRTPWSNSRKKHTT
jgi:hypothetical protein